ncbi:MAG: hypothetical protein CMB25_01805 [Euryarchaeota archaeon]|nr:hypothetical protein [Euryarchaeota archaeon]|tara:strand:+ start:8902 stop:9633 length:732 start_codon:yes stop_codon:yes gene_type:complete
MEGITTRITDNEIKQACKFAEQAYEENITNATRFDSKLGTTAFYLLKNDIQYIIFRGTNGDPSDWLMNLSAIPWRIHGKWVHGGFLAAQSSVWKQIRKCLDPSKKTYCIGHSLGGACAVITAHRLSNRHGRSPAFEDVRCITFGRPNVWLKSKTRLKDMVNISVVANSDIVAVIPKLFYQADSNQDIIYFGGDGNAYLNPTKEFRDGDRNLSSSISDHLMESSYSPRVKECKVRDFICDTSYL